MARHRLVIMLGAIVMTTLLMLTGYGQCAEKKYVFKIGHTAPAGDNVNTGALKLAELVAQKTNGQIKIEVYPDSQLGSPRTLMEGMQTGTQEMLLTGSDNVGAYDPVMDLIILPYMWDNPRDLYKFLDGPVGDQLAEHFLKKTGVRSLAYLAWGEREIYTDSKHPVRTMEELKGLKIRVPEAPVMIETLRMMGAAATPMPYNDVYSAIQTGVINGWEGTPSGAIKGKMYEITPNMTISSHLFIPAHFLISEKLYQSLPADLQKAIRDAAKEAAVFQVNLNIKETKEAIEESSKFFKIYTIDQKPFRKAARDLWYRLEKERGMPGMIDSMLAAQK